MNNEQFRAMMKKMNIELRELDNLGYRESPEHIIQKLNHQLQKIDQELAKESYCLCCLVAMFFAQMFLPSLLSIAEHPALPVILIVTLIGFARTLRRLWKNLNTIMELELKIEYLTLQ